MDVSFTANSTSDRSDSSQPLKEEDQSVIGDSKASDVETFYKGLKCLIGKSKGSKKKPHDDSQTSVKDQQLVAVHVCQCLYCYKMFAHSKYLVKHIIRRHPEELQDLTVKLNMKSFDVPRACKNSPLKTFEDELKDLRSTFDSRWSEMIKYIESSKPLDSNDHGHESIHRSETHRKNRRSKGREASSSTKVCDCDIVKESVAESEKRMKEMEKFVRAIEGKLDRNERNVDKLSSECLTMSNALSLSEKDLDALKQRTEKIVHSDREIQERVVKMECKMVEQNEKYVTDMQKLENKLKENDAKHSAHNIQQLLEEYLQEYLRKIGDKHSSVKKLRDRPQKSDRLLANKRKESGKGLRQAKPVNCSSVRHASSRDRKISMEHLCNEQSQLYDFHNTERTLDTQLEQKPPSVDVEVEYSVDIEALHSHLQDIVDSNISDLGIHTNNFKLTDSEYDKKLRLMRGKAQQVSNVYKDFWEIRSGLQKVVDKEVDSLIKIENSKVISETMNRASECSKRTTTTKASYDGNAVEANCSKIFILNENEPKHDGVIPMIMVTHPADKISELSEENESNISGHCPNYEQSATNKEEVTDKESVHRAAEKNLPFSKNLPVVENNPSYKTLEHVTAECPLKSDSIKSIDSASSLQSLSSWDSDEP